MDSGYFSNKPILLLMILFIQLNQIQEMFK